MKKKIDSKNILILTLTYIVGCITSFILLYHKDLSISDIQLLLSHDTHIESVDTSIVQTTQIEPIQEVVEPQIKDICVDVSGAVKNAGVYCMKDGSRIVDALKKAGGFVNDSAYKYISMNINLSAKLTDNSKLYIPYIKDLYCESVEFELPQKIVKVIKPIETPVEGEGTTTCININTASKDELDSLPGIGPSTAQKIIDARPFTSIEDIKKVSGIGDSTYSELKELICV